MSSVSVHAGTFRVQYQHRAVRYTLRLPGATRRQAAVIASHVDCLIAAATYGVPVDPSTLAWSQSLNPAVERVLANSGLVTPREARSLSEVISRELGRSDVSDSTKATWRKAASNLASHFGDCDIADITAADADEFRRKLLSDGLAHTTASKRCLIARGFFASAVKRGELSENPFAAVREWHATDPERKVFVPAETVQRLMAASGSEVRVVLALARFGGLRCPSEVQLVSHDDVDWNAGKVRVRSPKTRRCRDGQSRLIPLFRELRDVFREGGHGRLLPEIGGSSLHARVRRVARRIGIEPWPRLFHNLRLSRQTELSSTFPSHVVCAWMGNSPAVASRHYLTAREEDFRRAID